MVKMFYNGSDSLLRIVVVGVLAYIVLIAFLRVSGKRTLSKMNAFDLVITVAFGSTLATVLLTRDVALADGALAFAVLIILQFIVTWSSVRWRWFHRLVTGDPQMLMEDGKFIDSALLRSRITREEVSAAVRSAGLASLSDVGAVVLETDGSLSVVRTVHDKTRTSLEGVQ